MSELNIDKIVKALTICTTEEDCVDCPYLIKRGEGSVIPCQIDADALSLIKELTEENERLEKLSEDFGRDVDVKLKYILELEDKYDKELDKLKAEKADVTYFKEQLIADTVQKMQERLTKEFDRMHKNNFMTPEERQWIIDQIAKEMLEVSNE